jgi:hypothetical protein
VCQHAGAKIKKPHSTLTEDEKDVICIIDFVYLLSIHMDLLETRHWDRNYFGSPVGFRNVAVLLDGRAYPFTARACGHIHINSDHTRPEKVLALALSSCPYIGAWGAASSGSLRVSKGNAEGNA